MSQKEGSIIPSCALMDTRETVPEEEHLKTKNTVTMKIALKRENPWSQFHSDGEYMWVKKDINNIWRKIPLQLLKPNRSIIQHSGEFERGFMLHLFPKNLIYAHEAKLSLCQLISDSNDWTAHCSEKLTSGMSTSGIKKRTSNECFSTDKKSTDYILKKKDKNTPLHILYFEWAITDWFFCS